MTMTAYGHTSRLPKLAEFIKGPPQQQGLIEHLSGASFASSSPLTTSPRVVAFKSSGLGKIHFHHILYANGAPRPHRPLLVRTMQRRGELWDLERSLLDHVVEQAKEGTSRSTVAAAREGHIKGKAGQGKVTALTGLSTVTHWAPLTDFKHLRSVNDSKEAAIYGGRNTATGGSSTTSSPSKGAAADRTAAAQSLSSTSKKVLLMTRREETEAKIRLAREKVAALRRAKEDTKEAREGGSGEDSDWRNSKIDSSSFVQVVGGDDERAACVLGDVPAVLRVPRHYQPDANREDTTTEAQKHYVPSASSEEELKTSSSASFSASMENASMEELLEKEMLLQKQKQDAAIDRKLAVSWAVGERLGCEWLHSVWDPLSPPSAALETTNSIASDATASVASVPAESHINPILKYGAVGGSVGGVPASVGLTRPETMGHRIEFEDRVRASDTFIDYHFSNINLLELAEARSKETTNPIFHHPAEETFLFPTARLFIRIYVPKSAKEVCLRKNHERARAQLGSERRGASSSFTSYVEGATEGETYGLERPFHDVRVLDGDCVYIPRGWGYEIFREKSRVMTDTQRQKQSEGMRPRQIGQEAVVSSAFEDPETGEIRLRRAEEGEDEGLITSSEASESDIGNTSVLNYSSTNHLDAKGFPKSKASHAAGSAQPQDKFNWHRYQLEKREMLGNDLDKQGQGVVELGDRYGYKSRAAKSADGSEGRGRKSTVAVKHRGPNGKRLVHVDVPLFQHLSSRLMSKGKGDDFNNNPKSADEAVDQMSSSSLMISCDCFRVFFKPYPHLTPEQERAYLPALYTTSVDEFYSKGGNDPNKHFVH